MSTTYTNGNFTITIDQTTWAETIAAGETVATVTIENPNGLSYLELYGYDTNSIVIASSLNIVYGSQSSRGGMEFSEETSVTLQLVANRDIDATTLDLLNTYFTLYGAYWEEDATVDVDITINEAPEAISLTTSTVSEDAAMGTVIGALAATDAEGDAITYTLTDDADGQFTLVTTDGVTSLVLNGALDYEQASSYEIEVQAYDGYNTTTQTLTVAVGDVFENTAPTDIAISNATMKESARVGFVVGTLSATDAEGDAITWSLESGKGDNDTYFDLVENDDGTVNVSWTRAVGARPCMYMLTPRWPRRP